MKLDKYFHLYGDKDGVTTHFEEVKKFDYREKSVLVQEDVFDFRCSKCKKKIRTEYPNKTRFCYWCGRKLEILKGDNQ